MKPTIESRGPCSMKTLLLSHFRMLKGGLPLHRRKGRSLNFPWMISKGNPGYTLRLHELTQKGSTLTPPFKAAIAIAIADILLDEPGASAEPNTTPSSPPSAPPAAGVTAANTTISTTSPPAIPVVTPLRQMVILFVRISPASKALN